MKLTPDEKQFLRDTRPAGFILFARNCDDPDQLKRLNESVREAVQTDQIFIAIDQEGGRVQRLTPPHWRQYPTAFDLANIAKKDQHAGDRALNLVSQCIARDLKALAINMNCTPVLDLPVDGAHDIIGNRAYGCDPSVVARLARIVADAHIACGVAPVIKHIPGHGRSNQDSHLGLPTVKTPRNELEQTDFRPFKLMNDMPVAMTAHIVYADIDEFEPASTSPVIIKDIIREHIGFDGLLMSDDLSMHALEGSMSSRTQAVLSAGCDLALHCNGDFSEMCEVARNAPELAGVGLKRFQRALDKISGKNARPDAELDKKLDALLTRMAVAG